MKSLTNSLKNVKAIATALILTFVLFTGFQNVNAQGLESKVYATKYLLEAAGYTIVDADWDYLSQGESYVGERRLYGNNEYIVAAVTEDGVKDVDLYLYNSRGTRLTKDTHINDDGVAMVSYSPYYSQAHYIKASNYYSRSRYKEYGMVIIVAYK